MPGVPGKSCDNCRRRKKKCDQVQPRCGRCVYLGLLCVGSGKPRFKFQPTASQRSVMLAHSSATISKQPQDDMSMTCQSLVKLLEIDDPRFSVASLGAWLDEIPKRLRRNGALDAAARAFTTGMSVVHTGRISDAVVSEYSSALRALRETYVKGPSEFQTLETLCAIYMLMHCQSWLGGGQAEFSVHIQGMLLILNSDAAQTWDDPVSKQALGGASLLALSESIKNPNIKFRPRRKNTTEGTANQPSSPSVEPQSVQSHNLHDFAEYMREPEHYIDEIITRYDQAVQESAMMAMASTQMAPAIARAESRNPTIVKMYLLCQAGQAVIASLALILNEILRIMDPEDLELASEASALALRIIETAENAKQFQPLGGGFVQACLCAALATTHEHAKSERLQNLFVDYCTDFRGTASTDMAAWLQMRFRNLRKQQAARIRRDRGDSEVEPPLVLEESIPTSPSARPCCIM